ncbi:MAG: alpha/beta hydrolase [bacterium]|nr:alpha/beta hydrolase [bacterium]
MGTPALGDGLLLLHGAGGRALAWQNQLLAFPRARAEDLPGRAGGTPTSVDGFLGALREALGQDAAHGPGGAHKPRGARDSGGPLIVAGHSLGGAIALRWALVYPEEVRALVLLCTGARLRVAPQILEGIRAADPAAIEQFGAMWLGTHPTPRLREKSLALLHAAPAVVLAADLEAADGFDVMAELDHLALPVLVICGAEDRLTPVKYGRYLHERIAGSEMVVIERAGHMVMLEQPRAVNCAMQSFLERLDREAPGRDAQHREVGDARDG